MNAFRNLGSRLKVGTRVAIGFASILVLLGIVAAISYLGLIKSEYSTTRLSRIAQAFENVAAVNSNFAQMRRAVIVYAQTGLPDDEKKVREYERIIADNANAAMTRFISEEHREMMRGVNATFKQYVAGFDEIIKAKQAQADIDKTMRPLGIRMQKLLSDLILSSAMLGEMSNAAYAGMAQEQLLSARLSVNVYFTNPLPGIAKAAQESINKLPQSLKSLHDSMSSETDRARAVELEKLAATYVPGIAQTISITDVKNRTLENMGVKLAAKMNDQINALTATQMTALEEIRTEALSTINLAAALSLLIAGAAFAVGLSLAFFIGRGISKPLGKISALLAELAHGNKAVEIPYTGRRDEIGDNARAAQTFKEKLLRVEQMEAEQKALEAQTVIEREAAIEKMANEFEAALGGIVKAAVAGDFSQRVDLKGKTGLVLHVGSAINSLCENVSKALDDLSQMLDALAAGDMTRRITAQYEGNFEVLKANANGTAERIGVTIADIKAAAGEVGFASAEIFSSVSDLSQRTEEQAASLEETSASMEQIAATVRKNADNAQTASQSANAAREIANRGGQVVAEAIEAMTEIEESSRKVSDIIGVIDELARQTNLLALNAAVEAARAGEGGRGFAVVASEVRSLAQRSSQAAKDIKDLITNSNGQVKAGVELVNKAGGSLDEIVESIKKVTEIVAEIANASAEQASGIEQVGKALTQMDEATQQNSALVEQNAATAKTLERQAEAMNERVSLFKLPAGAKDVRATPVTAAKPPGVATQPHGPVAA